MGTVVAMRVSGDKWQVSSVELRRTEHELRQLHREQDTLAVVQEQQLLMMRALAAISEGHHDPRALAEAVIVVMDRAAAGAEGR